MWQRAKVIEHEGYNNLDVGRLVWVKGRPVEPNGKPRRGMRGDDEQTGDCRWFYTNLVDDEDDNAPIMVDAPVIELLNEFAEDIPITTWKEFLECSSGPASSAAP